MTRTQAVDLAVILVTRLPGTLPFCNESELLTGIARIADQLETL